jgi:NitT/TauT family transport system ATP-binding protein
MMVFQELDQLLPRKTVCQNVEFALEASGRLKGPQVVERAAYYLDKVGLSAFRGSYPHMLSGGMKQRVSIARGMAMEPDMLLMDEPFAALDALTRRKMQDELLRLWDDTHFTVMFVTHSIEEAVKVGTRILLLSPHPGQVKAELNGVPVGEMGTESQARLEARINEMLFAFEEVGA